MRLPLASPALPRPLPAPLLLVAGGAAGCALLVGLMSSVRPPMAVAVALLAITAPLVVQNLPLGIALWSVSLSLSGVPGLGLAANLGSIGLLFIWFGVLATKRMAVGDPLARIRPILTVAAGLLLWLGLTSLWARQPDLAVEQLLFWVLALVLLVVVVTTLDTPGKVRLVCAGFVAGAVASVLAGLLGGNLTETSTAVEAAQREGRFASAGNDPNVLAAGLVAATAVAVGMLPGARGPRRLALLLGIAVMVAGTAATQSRGGLVAAGVCVLAAIVLARGRRWQAGGLTLLILIIGAFALTSSPGSADRLLAFDNGGNGRSELWTVAWRMAEDHPVAGVGLNQYRVESAEYVREPGNLEFVKLIAEKPLVAHNAYLEMLAEAGAIGLLLLLAAVGLCALGSWRAARMFEDAGDGEAQALAQGVLVGQIGILTAAVFLSMAHNYVFWLVLALGPALWHAAGSARGAGEGPFVVRRGR